MHLHTHDVPLLKFGLLPYDSNACKIEGRKKEIFRDPAARLALGSAWLQHPADESFLRFSSFSSFDLRNEDGSLAFRSTNEKAGYGLQAGRLSLLVHAIACASRYLSAADMRFEGCPRCLQEQSFFNLPEKGWPRLQIHAGQQLLQHCLLLGRKGTKLTKLTKPVPAVARRGVHRVRR